MKALTLIMPYYDNPSMLQEQQQKWRRYPQELRSRLHIIMVDDCSPRWPALPHVQQPVAELGLASFQLYRTMVDVRWNWIFCRNLGVEKAPTEWLLMTDIDHVMPAKTLDAILNRKLDGRKAYRFSRVDAPDMTAYKPHPNTWLMTRGLFDRVGGYDERFSGYYGTDGEFRRRVQDNSEEIVILPQVMIRYPRELISDASTTTYERKAPEDRTNVKRIVLERRDIQGWKPLRVTFAYERLL